MQTNLHNASRYSGYVPHPDFFPPPFIAIIKPFQATVGVIIQSGRIRQLRRLERIFFFFSSWKDEEKENLFKCGIKSSKVLLITQLMLRKCASRRWLTVRITFYSPWRMWHQMGPCFCSPISPTLNDSEKGSYRSNKLVFWWTVFISRIRAYRSITLYYFCLAFSSDWSWCRMVGAVYCREN